MVVWAHGFNYTILRTNLVKNSIHINNSGKFNFALLAYGEQI